MKTFKQTQIELDATLIAFRVRIEYKKGLGIHTIAKKFNITSDRVKKYVQGVCCIAKTPRLPKKLCSERSKFWGIPVFRISCSKERLNINSEFHRRSSINTSRKIRKFGLYDY